MTKKMLKRSMTYNTYKRRKGCFKMPEEGKRYSCIKVILYPYKRTSLGWYAGLSAVSSVSANGTDPPRCLPGLSRVAAVWGPALM